MQHYTPLCARVAEAVVVTHLFSVPPNVYAAYNACGILECGAAEFFHRDPRKAVFYFWNFLAPSRSKKRHSWVYSQA